MGVGGVPTGAGLVDGGVDGCRRALGAGWQFQRRGLVGCSKRASSGRVGLLGSSTGGGKGSGGIQRLRFRKGRCVIF